MNELTLQQKAEVERFESNVIWALRHCALATDRLTKQLTNGRTGSEVNAAIIELRKAANMLEKYK